MLGRVSVGVGSSSRGGFSGSSSRDGFRGGFRGSSRGSGVNVVFFLCTAGRIVSTYDDIISCYMLCGTGCFTSYYFWFVVVTFTVFPTIQGPYLLGGATGGVLGEG